MVAGAGPDQGLHRHSAAQSLSIAAHFRRRARRQALRNSDPHRRDASHRRGRHRGALEIQGRQARRAGRPARRLAAAAGRVAAGHARSGRVHVHSQSGSLPGRGLLLHAERPRHRSSRRLLSHRFRLRRALRSRQYLHGRQSQRPHRAAALRAAQRRHRRCPDAGRPRAQQGLARDRQDFPRAEQDQAHHQRE